MAEGGFLNFGQRAVILSALKKAPNDLKNILFTDFILTGDLPSVTILTCQFNMRNYES